MRKKHIGGSEIITMKVEPALKKYLKEKATEKGISLSEYITRKVAPEYFQKQIENILHS